jgi:UrcA family protein
MTRSTNEFVLRRASERVSAGAAAIALTFLTLLTMDARAEEPKDDTTPRVTVSYPQMALDSATGAEGVYRKLKAAARKVCGITNGIQPVHEVMAANECYDKALADAVSKIDRPALTALHTGSARRYG